MVWELSVAPTEADPVAATGMLRHSGSTRESSTARYSAIAGSTWVHRYRCRGCPSLALEAHGSSMGFLHRGFAQLCLRTPGALSIPYCCLAQPYTSPFGLVVSSLCAIQGAPDREAPKDCARLRWHASWTLFSLAWAVGASRSYFG